MNKKIDTNKELDMVIVGGLGHVGLPLGLSFANEGQKVCLYDIDERNAEHVKNGKMPFVEYEAEPILKKVLANGQLTISQDKSVISKAKYVVIAIGTPVDEYLTPKVRSFFELFDGLKDYLDEEQIIIIRSTVYPKTCQQLAKYLEKKGERYNIAYCPERIVQGYSIKELKELPQIISGINDLSIEKANDLFSLLSPKIIKVSIEEAELAKLFTNAWRYIQFAMANQFYMISESFGVDFNRVRNVMMDSYGRVASLPGAGFAAGPCLLKDTMQLVASCSNNFFMGNAAMMVNEGLPNFLVEKLQSKFDLNQKTVGVLGMAFKADIDDIRDSLSYKLCKILKFHGAEVICSDDYVNDKNFVSKEELIKRCDIIVVGVPHSQYRDIVIPDHIELMDLWGIAKRDVSEAANEFSNRIKVKV